ncbi:hypothetical protein DQ384_36505 [Sphaerisporangium album]|uniref:Uncharacterized protein n=1 Tax=Sphaerisporangium album TaxID=509200 RepID=A0A367EVD3_9ACTN|nr:hypothetical protein [Sphaerisporangium album]RCG21120.1 hypothetical protein DQ384_36505 [Sphaerisporangium album]
MINITHDLLHGTRVIAPQGGRELYLAVDRALPSYFTWDHWSQVWVVEGTAFTPADRGRILLAQALLMAAKFPTTVTIAPWVHPATEAQTARPIFAASARVYPLRALHVGDLVRTQDEHVGWLRILRKNKRTVDVFYGEHPRAGFRIAPAGLVEIRRPVPSPQTAVRMPTRDQPPALEC